MVELLVARAVRMEADVTHLSVDPQISADGSSVEVALTGGTRVLGHVDATLVPPHPDRPSEGTVRFNVRVGATAACQLQEDATLDLGRMLERSFRDSNALDREALCVAPGVRVGAKEGVPPFTYSLLGVLS